MDFINRTSELRSLEEKLAITRNDSNQVYIIKADSGIGKTHFIKEAIKNLTKPTVEIIRLGIDEDYRTFKQLVIELDKISYKHGYNNFKNFYARKNLISKVIRLLLKILTAFIPLFHENNTSSDAKTFILEAPIENLFEYAKYVLSRNKFCLIYTQASDIDSSSLELLNQLILVSKGNIFIFECGNDVAEQHFKNSCNSFLVTYPLEKLSHEHIRTYIKHLSEDLHIHEQIDYSILEESISKGNLIEISTILKNFKGKSQEKSIAKMLNIEQIIKDLPENQIAFLFLVDITKNKLVIADLIRIMSRFDSHFSEKEIDFLHESGLVERKCGYVSLPDFVSEIVNTEGFNFLIRKSIESCFLRNINESLNESYKAEYLDVLVDYYLHNRTFSQIKSLLDKLRKRMLEFNSQQERVSYFDKFHKARNDFKEADKKFAIKFAEIAYDANLYEMALDFIDDINEDSEAIIFSKALILNRCERFNESINWIDDNLIQVSEDSPLFFNLSLVHIMNLIQLERRKEAKEIFEKIRLKKNNLYYPYLIRLSNVFENDLSKRLEIVESITNDIYEKNNSEFSGLHAIYLAYLYAINGRFADADISLNKARKYFGEKTVYNHMIFQNKVTIKFHKYEIDDSIPGLLDKAKITAYDEYDRLAICNNLLVYYILVDKVDDHQCQKNIFELEKLLEETSFKRFMDKINYNMYHYYSKMYDLEKSNKYESKLDHTVNKTKYNMRLLYETSWKLPLSLNGG